MSLIDHEKKPWGQVSHLVQTPHLMVSNLLVQAGTRCSRHYHEDRVNHFISITASLLVEIFDQYWVLTGVVPLAPGDSFTVAAKTRHRFRVHKPGRVVEVYWPAGIGECRVNDIIRMDEGGPDPMAADARVWQDAFRSWHNAAAMPYTDERELCRRIRDWQRSIGGGNPGA